MAQTLKHTENTHYSMQGWGKNFLGLCPPECNLMGLHAKVGRVEPDSRRWSQNKDLPLFLLATLPLQFVFMPSGLLEEQSPLAKSFTSRPNFRNFKRLLKLDQEVHRIQSRVINGPRITVA